MRAEVVAIGTELLLGTVVDTNSSWIGEQLALAGIDNLYQVKVGDNFGRMEATIRAALERSDAVICCGGLGPTQDDITRDVIARIMGVEMRRDQEIADEIRRRFEIRGRVMTANNLRQADIPVGASPIPQMPGTAPGLVCPVGDKVIYAVPGVPREMKEMMLGTVIPDLSRRSGQSSVIRSRTLRTWGISESGVDEMLTERMAELDRLGNPTIAFNASGIEGIKVRVTAKCDDEETARRILDNEEKIIRAVLGEAVFGIDDQSMDLVFLNMLQHRGLTLAAAEPYTGGIMAARMSAIDTELTTFLGATVSHELSAGLSLDVPGEERAAAVAERAREIHKSDVGLATIGADAAEGQPPGTVYVGIAMPSGVKGSRVVLPGNRAMMREYAVINLLDFARKVVAETM
ncbi:MAG: CinA family nicotinamide mononucleotide deamidase-related protein [Hyphomicrobiaceae bacterium]